MEIDLGRSLGSYRYMRSPTGPGSSQRAQRAAHSFGSSAAAVPGRGFLRVWQTSVLAGVAGERPTENAISLPVSRFRTALVPAAQRQTAQVPLAAHRMSRFPTGLSWKARAAGRRQAALVLAALDAVANGTTAAATVVCQQSVPASAAQLAIRLAAMAPLAPRRAEEARLARAYHKMRLA